MFSIEDPGEQRACGNLWGTTSAGVNRVHSVCCFSGVSPVYSVWRAGCLSHPQNQTQMGHAFPKTSSTWGLDWVQKCQRETDLWTRRERHREQYVSLFGNVDMGQACHDMQCREVGLLHSLAEGISTDFSLLAPVQRWRYGAAVEHFLCMQDISGLSLAFSVKSCKVA